MQGKVDTFSDFRVTFIIYRIRVSVIERCPVRTGRDNATNRAGGGE